MKLLTAKQVEIYNVIVKTGSCSNSKVGCKDCGLDLLDPGDGVCNMDIKDIIDRIEYCNNALDKHNRYIANLKAWKKI